MTGVGLSVHTLPHYDDVGLLIPADVDCDTGYRRYRRDQIRQAREIQALRWVDLAVDDLDGAIALYQRAFGFHYDVVRPARR